jgi:hypothetical protein
LQQGSFKNLQTGLFSASTINCRLSAGKVNEILLTGKPEETSSGLLIIIG